MTARIIVATFVAAAIAGCGHRQLPPTLSESAAVLPSGRMVHVSTDAPAARGGTPIDRIAEPPTVTLGTSVMALEPERIRVDGREVAEIPASTEEIRITERAGSVTISADGSSVHQFTR